MTAQRRRHPERSEGAHGNALDIVQWDVLTSLDMVAQLRYNTLNAMEFAVCRLDRKPPELMTPSNKEGVFLCSKIFGLSLRFGWASRC